MVHRQTGSGSGFRAYSGGGGRALISSVDDSSLMQTMNGSGMKGESFSGSKDGSVKGPESPQNYGFTSVVAAASKAANGLIKQSAEGFMSFMGGNRSFPVMGIMDDRRHRLKNLIKDAAEGSVAVHGLKEWGQQFLITDNGMFMTGNKGKTQSKGGGQGGGGAGQLSASQQAAAGGSGGGSQEGENFKIRFQLVENQNGKKQTQQSGAGAPKLARSFRSKSGVEFDIETFEYVLDQRAAKAGESGGGGNGAGGDSGGGETSSKPTGQKTLHKEESDTFHEITSEHQHLQRGQGNNRVKDKEIMAYYKDDKISSRVTDKHVHIRFEDFRIFVDEQGCWSTKPIQIKDDIDGSGARSSKPPVYQWDEPNNTWIYNAALDVRGDLKVDGDLKVTGALVLNGHYIRVSENGLITVTREDSRA